RLGGTAAADRAGVVVVAGVGGDEVEGAGRVELVRLRVRHVAVAERVDVRGQVGDQAGAVVLGVEGVGNRPSCIRGRTGQRGRVVGRVTDLDRAGRHDHRRDARRVPADGQRLGGTAAADRAGVVVVAGVGGDEVEGAGRVELVRLRVRHV